MALPEARPVELDQPRVLARFILQFSDGLAEGLPFAAAGDRAQGGQQEPRWTGTAMIRDGDFDFSSVTAPSVAAVVSRVNDGAGGGRGHVWNGHCVQVYIEWRDPRASMAAKRCSSSREGKVLLSCWIPEELRLELDRVWAAKGLRPHGRTQKGMEEMIALYLAPLQMQSTAHADAPD